MATGEFRHATRDMTSLLAPLERRCLIWLAGRLPAWVNSDHLTLLALVSMIGAGAAFWLGGSHPPALLLVIACLAINWFGDSLDGTLARVRNQQRPRYGFYVDHVLDVVGILFLLGGLALSGFMHPYIALGLLVAYYMLSIEVYLATYCLARFRMAFWSFGPTELRIVLAAGTLALFLDPARTAFGGPFRLFDVGGLVAIVGLGVALLVSVATNTRALYLAEPRAPSRCS